MLAPLRFDEAVYNRHSGAGQAPVSNLPLISWSFGGFLARDSNKPLAPLCTPREDSRLQFQVLELS